MVKEAENTQKKDKGDIVKVGMKQKLGRSLIYVDFSLE